MIEGIYGFDGYYRFLSNFWGAEVELEGKIYPSVEHAYQAAKTLDNDIREEIRTAVMPSKAKRIGSSLETREDWEEIKVAVMKDLLTQKFAPGTKIAEKLLETEDLYIEETNYWNDRFWGVCGGFGQNVLGNLLMEIRKNLKK